MTRLYRTFALCACAVALSACSGLFSQTEVRKLNEVEAIGSPFTQQLAGEYRVMANYEQNDMYDYPDALHFARKGLLSAQGETVLPEPLDNWSIREEFVSELQEARARLINSLDKGAREIAPHDTAVAQARYDCWIEQQEEIWQQEDIDQCRDEFFAVIGKVESALGNIDDEGSTKKEEKAVDAVSGQDKVKSPTAEELAEMTGLPKLKQDELIPTADAMFLTFFDFNSAKVEAGAEEVVAAVAEDILHRDDVQKVVVKGHADTSGPAKYNKRLSQNRADAVKKALVSHGVDEAVIETVAMGEEELLVPTGNNTREPANRRAEIRFE